MDNRVVVKSYRTADEDPPVGYADSDLWFRTQDEVPCDGRAYYGWAFESKPGTVNILEYHAGEVRHTFDFVPYRERTFSRVARHLMSAMGVREVIVWSGRRAVKVQVERLRG